MGKRDFQLHFTILARKLPRVTLRPCVRGVSQKILRLPVSCREKGLVWRKLPTTAVYFRRLIPNELYRESPRGALEASEEWSSPSTPPRPLASRFPQSNKHRQGHTPPLQQHLQWQVVHRQLRSMIWALRCHEPCYCNILLHKALFRVQDRSDPVDPLLAPVMWLLMWIQMTVEDRWWRVAQMIRTPFSAKRRKQDQRTSPIPCFKMAMPFRMDARVQEGQCIRGVEFVDTKDDTCIYRSSAFIKMG